MCSEGCRDRREVGAGKVAEAAGSKEQQVGRFQQLRLSNVAAFLSQYNSLWNQQLPFRRNMGKPIHQRQHPSPPFLLINNSGNMQILHDENIFLLFRI